MNPKTATMLLILSCFLATAAATDIYLASLPGMVMYFSTSIEALQTTIAVFLLAQVFAAPMWGSLSDHYSRKKILFVGMLFFITGSILCSISSNIWFFLIGRFIQGAGSVAAPVIGWATISELYSKDEGAKIMSFMGGVMTIVPLIAPMIGGEIDTHFGWRANFFLIIAVTAISLFLMKISKFEHHHTHPHEAFNLKIALQRYIPVLLNKSFVAYVLVFALLCAGEFAYLAIAPFYFETLNLSAREIGFIISLTATSYLIGSFGAPKLIKRIGNTALFKFGIACCIAASVFLIVLHMVIDKPLVLFCSAVAFYLFGLSLIWGPSTSRALQQIPPENRGKASAARSLLNTLIQSSGAAMGGLLPDNSIFPLALFFLAMSLCALAFFNVAKKFDNIVID